MSREHEAKDDPNSVHFWDALYKEGRDGWDLGEPAPSFVDLLVAPGAPAPGKLITLGCGRGYDAILFARHGFEVTAVDFAPTAIRDARRAAEQAGVSVDFVQHDLFALDESYNGRFDYVLEHTCFAAINPRRRDEYVQLVRRLLKPSGLYIALFFSHGKPGGPPHSTDAEEVRRLFGPYFTIEKLGSPARSVERRQGQEIFALMRPRRIEERA
jgi:SAM-dependent methyltransferase